MMTDTVIGCEACTFGDVSHYFTDREKGTIRIDFTYCTICHPNATGNADPRIGEKVIDVVEFNKLFEQGWREVE